MGSVGVAHGLNCPAAPTACEIFPERGSNRVPCTGGRILHHWTTRGVHQGFTNTGRLGVFESVPAPVTPLTPLSRQEQPAMAAHLLRLPVPAAHRLQHAQTHLENALQGGRPGECSGARPAPSPPSRDTSCLRRGQPLGEASWL